MILLFSALAVSCARVGSPVGGAKDSLAPEFLRSNIDTSRVNVPVDLKELRLDFNEYITLKDVQKNLIISPPIAKIKRILPSSLGNKFVLIQWEDTLQENTTYNFNFGNAIADLNEGNILPYFNFAFSTGDHLDELYISGEVKDALSNKEGSKKNYVVGLYKESDSMDFRQKPYYITKADPDGYYELNYLTPGKYSLIAFEDENQNSVFEAGKESVAFRKEPIDLQESISGLNLKVYPSRKAVRFLETKVIPGGILMLFEGKPTKVEVRPVTEKISDYKVTHKPRTDSAMVWFDAEQLNVGVEQNERIELSYDADGKQDTIQYTYRYNKNSEFVISNAGSNLIAPNSDFVISANMPVANIQPEKWSLESDSVAVGGLSAKISEDDMQKILVSGNFAEGKKYSLTVPKGTVSSFYETLEKSFQFNFEIARPENFGSFTLNLINPPQHKFWIQFLDKTEKIRFQRYTSDVQNKFTEIPPDTYSIRILVDNNGNGFWDEADFNANSDAEEAYLFPKTIEIRPLWENVENWDLKQDSVNTPTNLENPE